MKKLLTLTAMTLLFSGAAMAQGAFPDPLPDPQGVPIIESIVGLLGLGGAYAVKVWRNKKKEE